VGGLERVERNSKRNIGIGTTEPLHVQLRHTHTAPIRQKLRIPLQHGSVHLCAPLKILRNCVAHDLHHVSHIDCSHAAVVHTGDWLVEARSQEAGDDLGDGGGRFGAVSGHDRGWVARRREDLEDGALAVNAIVVLGVADVRRRILPG
jgi:hypothetical protein